MGAIERKRPISVPLQTLLSLRSPPTYCDSVGLLSAWSGYIRMYKHVCHIAI